MSERPKLEPCPLCAEPGQMKDAGGGRIRQGWVGCPKCGLYINWKISPAGAVKKWNRRTQVCVKVPLFDMEELYPDCTVQILTNTETGETSVGWWPNEKGAPDA